LGHRWDKAEQRGVNMGDKVREPREGDYRSFIQEDIFELLFDRYEGTYLEYALEGVTAVAARLYAMAPFFARQPEKRFFKRFDVKGHTEFDKREINERMEEFIWILRPLLEKDKTRGNWGQ